MRCGVLLSSDVRDVFDLFDFWDGRDGMVDGAKIGDVMRCIGLNPTNKIILDNGGCKKLGLRHPIVITVIIMIRTRTMMTSDDYDDYCYY